MKFYYGHHPMADYFSPMDNPGYNESVDGEYKGSSQENKSPIGISDIGMSVPMGIAAGNVSGIYAKIRAGAGSIEIGFPGAGGGQRQAQTPGMYGEDQRQAIRELGAINDVKFTTHAAYNIMGLSGFTGDNPYNVWFQREQRKMALDEVKRAIEFARDTAGGGSVVVHSGEVDRPISEQAWARRSDGRLMFKQFEEEPDVARIRVVDERSGQVMQQVRKNHRVARPDWLTAGYYKKTSGDLPMVDTKGNKVEHVSDNDYVDYLGRVIPKEDWFNPETGRVPIYDTETGRFRNKLYTWNDMIREAQLRNEWTALQKGKRVQELDDEERITPDEVYLRSTLETNEGHSRGWALQYGHQTDKELEQLRKLKKSFEFYKKIENNIPKDELWRIMKEDNVLGHSLAGQFIPSESKLPTQILQENIKQLERGIEFARQASASQELQAEDSSETQQHLINADKYAIREAVKGYAAAAIHAMDSSFDPKKPVFLAIENIFPERYGGHPSELKNLILKSREEMVDRLSHKKIKDPSGSRWLWEDAKKGECNPADVGHIKVVENPYYRGLSEEEARKKAEQHIKATIDTGHMNMWRKYFQVDPKKTPQQNDAEFKRWYLNQIEDLAKDKIIGNMHLTDNMGYQDDHLAPGQGNAPVKEVVQILKKHGYDKALTVEPGADASTDVSDFHGLMKAWRHFDAPIYGMGMSIGRPQNWADVQYSYFGQNRPPQYLFGAYSPSNDWTLWSQVPME